MEGKMSSTVMLGQLMEKQLEIKEGDTDQMAEKWMKHYSSKYKILLVGEGDFSFAACLAKAFGNASNMVATSRDSQDELEKKYVMAKSNLEILEGKGCTIVHEVDALTMSKHPALKNLLFDRIVFNFPHSGILWLYREHDPVQIELHRDLVGGFFKSAYKLVAEDGEVHITHKTAHPFDRWYIEELADEKGLSLISKHWFNLWEYPGYTNKKGEGHGDRCDGSFNVGECYTFKFGKCRTKSNVIFIGKNIDKLASLD